MSDMLRFFLLGFGPGGIYALLAMGIVLVYRGSGVVNFGAGGFALLGSATFYELRNTAIGTPGAIAVAILATACLGVLVQLLILHPMRAASPLARVVATSTPLNDAPALERAQVVAHRTRSEPGQLRELTGRALDALIELVDDRQARRVRECAKRAWILHADVTGKASSSAHPLDLTPDICEANVFIVLK